MGRKGGNKSDRSTKKASGKESSSKPSATILVGGGGVILAFLFYLYSSSGTATTNAKQTSSTGSGSSGGGAARRSNNPSRPEATIVAARGDVVESQWWDVPCAATRNPATAGCTPTDRCGRFLTDIAFEDAELLQLKAMAEKWMKLGGAAGGPTILDLHSGALSVDDQFIDVYQEVARRKADIYDPSDFAVYRKIKNIIKSAVEEQFQIGAGMVHLTSPTFFSEISDRKARTEHDEYWHLHVDKVTYGSFDYTCLLYLTDYNDDFEGGEFWFENKTSILGVEPKRGRLSCFTSGAENAHNIARVTSGRRFALTVAFSCDAEAGIEDPTGDRAVAPAASA